MYKALICSACAAVILVSGVHLYDRHTKLAAINASVHNLISALDEPDKPQRNAEEVAIGNDLRNAW